MSATDDPRVVRAPVFEEVGAGLAFPEGGPIYLDDGSLILVEIGLSSSTSCHQ